MKKGIIYVRVSSVDQTQGTSLDNQERACLEYATNSGIEVVRTFIEKGESATAANRTEFLKALEYCRQQRGELDFFIVWKIDRFARNTTDHFSVRAKLTQYGITLQSVTEPITQDHIGKLMETFLAGYAEFENEVRKQRCTGGMQGRLREGIWCWWPPIGYVHSIVFRVGDDDAKKLADGFSSFEADDLKNLETGQAICRVERSNYDFNLSIPLPDMPDDQEMEQRQKEVIAASRAAYGTARSQVEAMLRQAWEVETAKPSPVKSKPGPDEPPASPPSVQPVAPIPPPLVPKVAEVQKGTDSEKKIVEPPRDLGRGGAQHQAIQKRIKEAAEELGFRSVIEKSVLDGQGSVDLWLERAGETIACEVSISTTIDHEVGNVAKCLKAGVPKVKVICLDEERLRKIGKAVSGSLGSELAARVEYFQPDPFIAYLKALKPPTPQPSETQYGGYKVKRSIPKLSAQEQRQKEDIANRIMAETMRRK
jgi:DNA invertase Pin-like site-specific DNA recombinase